MYTPIDRHELEESSTDCQGGLDHQASNDTKMQFSSLLDEWTSVCACSRARGKKAGKDLGKVVRCTEGMPIPAKEGVEGHQEFSRLLLVQRQQRQVVNEFFRRQQERVYSAPDYEQILPVASCLNDVVSVDGLVIAADTQAFVAKLYELFVQELALRAWVCAQSRNSCIILDTDIAEAITTTPFFRFLRGVLRRHQLLTCARHGARVGSGGNRNWPYQTTSFFHYPQALNLPYVPISESSASGALVLSNQLAMVVTSTRSGSDSRVSPPLVELVGNLNSIDKESMVSSDVAATDGCAKSTDAAATVTKKDDQQEENNNGRDLADDDTSNSDDSAGSD
ncbi:hypothetical protein GUJ93_ZPchr0010g10747 [Zizania palustris]|uniref:Histone H2A/H2B/H3 domain-containing protein n=1 Tax=Zizania palustris TaxID=103762 RepID=A0A8J5WG43_ZIZPA|nr:hypothetical protein GUJ93_ZPchr0010g10747 [Zizania palustris]